MKYSKIQKFLSSFIIFSLLFSITFRVPISDFGAYAGSSDFFNLVSVLVDEDSYSKVSSEIDRYARDIQGVLENTKVVVLPTPKDASAFKIASLLEGLYFEGYKSLVPDANFESKLVGTVLVGDFDLPVVYNNSESSKTIIPYTDFEDKAYIYNHESKKYENNDGNQDGLHSEIWHGVISPNTGSFNNNINGLKNYFNKNHDYYSGTGNFKFSEGILNGNKHQGVPSTYNPFVFYYDQFRENASLNSEKYNSYELYLKYFKEVVYNRFSKDLAEEIIDETLGDSMEKISDLTDKVAATNNALGPNSLFGSFDSSILNSMGENKPDVSNTPDIQARHIIENVTKKFIEIFSEGTFGEFRKDVHNAGRYNNTGTDVNVDFIPYLITILDAIHGEMIKNINDELEAEIDNMVPSGTPGGPTAGEPLEPGAAGTLIVPTKIVKILGCRDTFENYFYGKKVADIESAEECSIYRGSTENGGKLIEANRGYNVNLAQEDFDKLGEEPEGAFCQSQVSNGESLNGRWGGNSPLNLDVVNGGELNLKSQDVDGALVPLFDLGGSKEVFDSSKINSPADCLNNNFISTQKNLFDEEGAIMCLPEYTTPTFGDVDERFLWTCVNDNNSSIRSYEFSTSFEELFETLEALSCEKNTIFLDGEIVKEVENTEAESSGGGGTGGGGDTAGGGEEEGCEIEQGTEYYFKTISSVIEHKSPTTEELQAGMESMASPDLPVDVNRYVEFTLEGGEIGKIEYPSLFELSELEDGEEVTFDSMSEKLDNLLKKTEGVDLIATLKNEKSNVLVGIGGGGEMTQYDMLVFSLYWHSLSSVAAKYAFIFDYYLNDQSDNPNQKYKLLNNKKEYEIAYLGAEGDVRNMYVKLDPQGKEDNPYADLISENIKLSSSLLASNIGNSSVNSDSTGSPEGSTPGHEPTGEIPAELATDGGMFECAPPDGVPIWEWIPAVMCRLGDMLPPTISFSDGKCGSTTLFNSDEGVSSWGLLLEESGSDSGASSSEGNSLSEDTGSSTDGDSDDGNDSTGDDNSCNLDSDKNGLNDCVEQELKTGGFIELMSDSKKYYFNSTASLKAKIKDKNGNIITSADNSYVTFTLEKIEEARDDTKEISNTNKKNVYNINSSNINDEKIIKDYAFFKNYKIRSNNGVAKYQIASKQKEANIYLRASIISKDNSGKEVINVESELLKIEIRGSRLFNKNYKFKDDKVTYGIDSLKVSDETNIFFIDGTNKSIEDFTTPISNLSTSDEKMALFVTNISPSGKNRAILYPLKVTLFEGNKKIAQEIIEKDELTLIKSMFKIKKSGSYMIEIVDNDGYETTKEIELLPEEPSKINIELGTTVMQTGGNVSTNFVTLHDKYDNVTSGKFYDLEFSVDGKGIKFLNNNSDDYKTNTFEGYKIFRLKSTSKKGDNKITVTVSDRDGNKYTSSNKDINVLDEINVSVIPKSGDIKVGGGIYKYEISVKDKNGVTLTDFNSRAYMTSNSVFIEAVNPYVNLVNGKAEIEFKTKTVAGKDVPIEFQVEGLDEIITRSISILPGKPMKVDLILSQNKIEASPSATATVSVELKDRYNNLVFNDNSTRTNLEILSQYSHVIKADGNQQKVKEGISSYTIYGTSNPGVANFKVSTNPSLSVNSFTIEDKGGEETVHGVGASVGNIQTFYFWNKGKIQGKKYNSLYTTLLGSNYGDITEKDYLAGSLLFENNNRSLAVTSLLNNPFKYSNILKINNNGGVEKVQMKSDLSQDIEVETSFKDDKLIFDLYNKAINIYIGKLLYNFDDTNELIVCDLTISECFDENSTSIVLKSSYKDYNVYLDNGRLILRDINGKNIIEIEEDGVIHRNGTLDFEFNEKDVSGNVIVNISTGGRIIAELGFNFVDSIINTSRDETIFNSKVNSLKNSILLLLKTYSYGTYDSGNIDDKSKIIYYNDPFSSDNVLNSFSKTNLNGYENFVNKDGVGWKESNKSLLAFAAGKIVGESVKDYMSFSVINLGDPVLSVKKVKRKIPNTNYDKKFDSTIGKLLDEDIKTKAFHVFDYDNDNLVDILLVKKDNYFELLENKNIHSRQLDKGNLAHVVDLGNPDLVGVGDFSKDGYSDIFFVNNEGNPFLLNNVEKDFERYSLVDAFDLDGKIIQAKVFDMDNDGYSDVVTLDDSGEINIHYGAGPSSAPNFTKLTISEKSGIKLSSGFRNDNSLVYFDPLFQPSGVENAGNRIDNLIYRNVPYSNDKEVITYEDVASGKKEIPDSSSSTYFLRTEYSESAGLKVQKKFKDRNGDYVQSSDIIDAEIFITNTSSQVLSKIAFLEKLPNTFSLDESSVKSEKKVNIQAGLMSYDFLIDDFSLNPGEKVKITYEAKVRPIKYSFIDVGLFETGEIGDDLYGDVIVKDSNENCGQDVDIYRSIAERGSRFYLKGTKSPTCDESKIELPDNIKDNMEDGDGNNVPDYIDELTSSAESGSPEGSPAQEFAQEQMDDLNSDGDDLGSISAELEASIEEIDNFVQGLSCGFGGAGCISLPLNRAPLAPGNDIVFQGEFYGDGLNIDEGMPVFSSLTGLRVGPYCIPSVWPISPLTSGTCEDTNAGGRLGIDSAANAIRFFVTPTLTGGVGIALCFGGPASVVGDEPPPSFSPLEPGGNCIILAEKFDWCGADGSDGAPGSAGVPAYAGGAGGGNGSNNGVSGGSDSFGIINGNCNYNSTANNSISSSAVDEYFGKTPSSGQFASTAVGASNNSGGGPVGAEISLSAELFVDSPNDSLYIEADGADVSVSLDLAALLDGDYEDIIKIVQERIFSFPDWFMGWVTRQIEEIANKLTDWPTIYIILPDFTGIFDTDWGEDLATEEKKTNENDSTGGQRINSGIQEVYEFIGSIPLVSVDKQTVNIMLPWVSQIEIDKAIASRELTVHQREAEKERALKRWSGGFTCNENTSKKQAECEKNNAIGKQAAFDLLVDIDGLIDGLYGNIEVMREYIKIPEKINKLLNFQQVYLEQILCNVETISSMLGGRIGENGKRFKAWVEVYILVKAILDGWQAIVDVFFDYEAECHDCKNERQDGLEWLFKLISLIVPDIPVIRFPKWPDIIVDLHNIRAGLKIALPEFAIDTKPILLPQLPDLFLPDVPYISVSLDFKLPEIPVLPMIDIPELPEMPSLPSVELPNLPPPPNLPDILSEIQAIVEIAELIIEAMCILKSSPFHPEWRAGDQIAFLTERGGYLPTDFIEVSFPEFSYPFVDAIEVKPYVNLEFETDFIVELAKQIAMPINSFSNDFINLFDLKNYNLDFTGATPGNVSIEGGGEIGVKKMIGTLFAKKISRGMVRLSSALDRRKNDTISITNFRKKVSDGLASEIITSNPKYDKLRKIWENTNNYTYSKEDKIIEELQENNKQKFNALTDIINTEIIKNKELKKKLQNYQNSPIVTEVGFNESSVGVYNETLSVYNNKFKESAKKLMNSGDYMKDSLTEKRENLLYSIKTPLDKYRAGLPKKSKEDLIAANTTTTGSSTGGETACQAQQKTDYKFEYEGIYILDRNTSYRLFDYLDDLDGKEITTPVDLDNDGDEDIIYLVRGQVYFKENLQRKPSKGYVSTAPLVVNITKNKFFNGDIFYEAINNIYEAGNANGTINLMFSRPTNKEINNFRLGLYTIVDKYLNLDKSSYIPGLIKKDIIDSVAGIDQITETSRGDININRKNIVYIKNVGDLRGVKLKTSELFNIKDDLSLEKVVNIRTDTSLYAGSDDFTIEYYEEDDESQEINFISIKKYENIEFIKNIVVVGINGDAYIKGRKDIYYEGTQIRGQIGKPLFPGSVISYIGNEDVLSRESYVELLYYDDSELNIDFDLVDNWELSDLGDKREEYFLSAYRFNDYYYGKISGFKDNVESTLSEQILLAPQMASDKSPPSLSMDTIKIPIYQKEVVDLTSYIYEFGGINNVKKVYIDMDLEEDTSGDGNPKNDNDALLAGDYNDKIDVQQSLISLKIEFGEFTEIFKRNIGITLIDSNNNAGFRDVEFEVYSPLPTIDSYSNGNIGGNIDEELTNEPISIFRYRGGAISKLETENGNIKTFTDNGKYSFDSSSKEGGLTLYRGSQDIAFIDEVTGKITFKDSSLNTEVLSSNNSANEGIFPRIIIKEGDDEIFYEYIQLEGINKVDSVDSFKGLKERGLYFNLRDKNNYDFYTVPETLQYNPGALFVYRQTDSEKESLFTIFKDGRINTLNGYYKLEYSYYDDYVVIKLVDGHYNRTVGKLLFLIEGEYIME